MAFAAAIGPIIGAVASIAGAAISASAMNAQAQREEEIANYNAEMDRRKAALAQSQGALESSKLAKKYDQASAMNRAITAESGFSTTEGTPLLQQQHFAAQKMWDTNIQMADATIKQRDLLDQAQITQWEGQEKARATRIQAGASLLGGFAGAVKSIGGAFG